MKALKLSPLSQVMSQESKHVQCLAFGTSARAFLKKGLFHMFCEMTTTLDHLHVPPPLTYVQLIWVGYTHSTPYLIETVSYC